MVKRQRRAQGGGRKPRGEFDQLTSMFSLRMPQDLREQLDAAAEKNGRSAAQELLMRLNMSFADKRDKNGDRPTRAFNYLFARLGEVIHKGQANWHTNPFLFRAFKWGVGKLLDYFEPEGEIETPHFLKQWAETMARTGNDDVAMMFKTMARSPEGCANAALVIILNEYNSPGIAKSIFQRTMSVTDDPKFSGIRERGLDSAERLYYGMTSAQRDLEPNPNPTAEPKSK